MNRLSDPKTAPFDSAAITATIERAFASSGMQKHDGLFKRISETIRRALGPGSDASKPGDPAAAASPSILERFTRGAGKAPEALRSPSPALRPKEALLPGAFVTRTFSNAAGSRDYKLYVPSPAADTPMPLVVMLHGCTQSPDDFAAGTQMNRLAQEQGFLVVYPEQSASANPSKCWNWFSVQDQARGIGEPSIIAGIVREVSSSQRVDPARIFVAGLSAGAAMAVVLGETYPELFASVGVHSGLPYAAAHDMPSAFAAMKGGRGSAALLAQLPGAVQQGASRKATQALPTIVFHGDHDQTVGVRNATEIVTQAVEANARAGRPLRSTTLPVTTAGGRSCSRTVYTDESERPRLESWMLHGAGHAWAGGSASGSYTDPSGPDASAEMLRFFLAQRNAAH